MKEAPKDKAALQKPSADTTKKVLKPAYIAVPRTPKTETSQAQAGPQVAYDYEIMTKPHRNAILIGDTSSSYMQGLENFETENFRFTLYHTPPAIMGSMISTFAISDIAVLEHPSLSTNLDEYEMVLRIAKWTGLNNLIIAIKKADCTASSTEWDAEITKNMKPVLQSIGYNVEEDVKFIPISSAKAESCGGTSLSKALDSIKVIEPNPDDELMMFITKSNPTYVGHTVWGNIQRGSLVEGETVVLKPSPYYLTVEVKEVYRIDGKGPAVDGHRVKSVGAGENVKLELTGTNRMDNLTGYMLVSMIRPIPTPRRFLAELEIVKIDKSLPNKLEGFQTHLYLHHCRCPCWIKDLYVLDSTTLQRVDRPVSTITPGDMVLCAIEVEEFVNMAVPFAKFILLSEDPMSLLALGKVIQEEDFEKVSLTERIRRDGFNGQRFDFGTTFFLL